MRKEESTRDLIMAKARVSHVKQQSIPRLELLDVTVGVKLFQIVDDRVRQRVVQARCCVCIHRLHNGAGLAVQKLSSVGYICEQPGICQILEVVQRKDWYHVPRRRRILQIS